MFLVLYLVKTNPLPATIEFYFLVTWMFFFNLPITTSASIELYHCMFLNFFSSTWKIWGLYVTNCLVNCNSCNSCKSELVSQGRVSCLHSRPLSSSFGSRLCNVYSTTDYYSTECPIIYRKSVRHLRKYRFVVYLSICCTYLR